MAIERTLSIIKPDAVAKNVIGEIYTRFEQAGLKIVASKMMQLTDETAGGFYAEHQGKGFYGDLIEFMTSGPVVVQVLEGENAVLLNRELMGATNPAEAAPGTIRSDFAQSIDAERGAWLRFHDFCGAGSQLFLYERRNLPAQLSVRKPGGSQGAIMKPNLLGLSREKIKALFSELEEKPFRTQQVMQWIHQRGCLISMR